MTLGKLFTHTCVTMQDSLVWAKQQWCTAAAAAAAAADDDDDDGNDDGSISYVPGDHLQEITNLIIRCVTEVL